MQNIERWIPTKFIRIGDHFCASKNLSKVGIGYRLLGDIQASNYSELTKDFARGALLDLGCGDVALLEMYKPYVQNVFCADWPHTTHNISFVDFQMDTNKSFPIKDNQFDTILVTDVLEHISNPDNAWKEMTRILKPGGRIILSVPFMHLIHEEPYDFYRFTEFRLKLFCEENNLKILKLYAYGGSLELFFDFTSKHLSYLGIFAKFYYYFAKFILKSSIAKKVFKLTAVKYPLGYCLVAEK